MLPEARSRLRALMEDIPQTRPCCIRRSDDDRFLLATDLPLVTDEAAFRCLMVDAENAGFRCEIIRNWLFVDCAIEPETEKPPVFSPEGRCCLSILKRHPDGETDAIWLRRVVKAFEAGEKPLEKCFAQLHMELAARLRQHRPLPTNLIPYLANMLKEEPIC